MDEPADPFQGLEYAVHEGPPPQIDSVLTDEAEGMEFANVNDSQDLGTRKEAASKRKGYKEHLRITRLKTKRNLRMTWNNILGGLNVCKQVTTA